MEYIILIPLFIVITYGLFLLNKQVSIHSILIACVLLTMTLIGYFILNNYLSTSENLVTLLVLDTIIFFLLLRLQNKVTILFFVLFITSIGLLLFLSYQYNEIIIYLSFLIAIVFLLAENNQTFMRKSYEESATEYQNKILNKQVEEVQNIYLTMRSWRHDYHNHLQKLKAHIIMDQVKEANQYLNELEIDLDR